MKIPWSKPDIGLEEKRAVQRVMDSGWLSQGPETEDFERELAGYIGCKHVVCVNNGTSALMCALAAYDVKDIAAPVYSFPATWNAVRSTNKQLYLKEVDPNTFIMYKPNEDMACMPVSVAGLPLNPEDWTGKLVIEDACESLGAVAKGRKVGNQGWTACFSFHIAKLLTTVEGGCIATDDDAVAYECRMIRSHGENPKRKYDFKSFGLNLRTTDIASAIGRVQLAKLQKHLENRCNIAKVYRETLQNFVGFQEVPDYVDVHANMFFPILVDEPDKLAGKLLEKGIETRRPWPPAISLPNAMRIYNRILAIPIYNTMQPLEAMYVVEQVKWALQ